MRRSSFVPFCLGASLVGSLPLHAQTVESASAKTNVADPQTPADSTQSAQSPAPQQKITTSETVTVTALGETRDVQSIDSTALLESTPGTSPIAALAHLPSVEVTSADPYGAYEWALRISVRGFNQNQLGFTLDDVPLGDMSYGNLNGLHISRALIDENLGRASLSQGTASLETASTSNLGGAVQFFSNDPADKAGLSATQSFGSFSGTRTFARYDSGLLSTHTKLFVDGVYQSSQKWRGDGPIRQSYYQFNTKLQQFVGAKGVFTAYADFSNRQEVDYQDENFLWTSAFGYHTDNFGDWNTALQAANAYNAQGGGGHVFSQIPTVFPGAIPSIQPKGFGDLSNDPEDIGYYAAGGLRKDFLGYLKYNAALTSHLTFKTTVYGHHNAGTGLWYTPYLATYDPSTGSAISPISERTSEYRIARGGVLGSLSYETSRNTVEGGVWFEKESFDLARRFYGTTLQGPTFSIYDTPKNPFYTQWAYNFPTNLFQIHLQDRFKITPAITLAAGFKTSETYTTGNLVGFNEGINLNPSASSASYAQGKLTSGKPFLPQVGFDWKLGNGNEVFADVAENVRAFQAGGNGFGTSPWGTSQAGFNALTNNLKSESSWSEEAGFRHTTSHVDAQANYFHVNFSNRLLAIQQGPGIAGNASLLSNVGGGDHQRRRRCYHRSSRQRLVPLQRPHLFEVQLRLRLHRGRQRHSDRWQNHRRLAGVSLQERTRLRPPRPELSHRCGLPGQALLHLHRRQLRPRPLSLRLRHQLPRRRSRHLRPAQAATQRLQPVQQPVLGHHRHQRLHRLRPHLHLEQHPPARRPRQPSREASQFASNLEIAAPWGSRRSPMGRDEDGLDGCYSEAATPPRVRDEAAQSQGMQVSFEVDVCCRREQARLSPWLGVAGLKGRRGGQRGT